MEHPEHPPRTNYEGLPEIYSDDMDEDEWKDWRSFRLWFWRAYGLFVACIIVLIVWMSNAHALEGGGHKNYQRDTDLSYDNVTKRAIMCAEFNKPKYFLTCMDNTVNECIQSGISAVESQKGFQTLLDNCVADIAQTPDATNYCKDEALVKVIECIGLDVPKVEDYLDEND